MKSASPELIALLDGMQQFRMSDLYTLTLVGGGIYTYTSWDVDQVWNGKAYSSVGALFTRSRVRTVIGVEVDELTFGVTAAPTLLIAGVPFLHAVRRGLLDGASLTLERAFMSAPPAVVGTLIQFSGKVSTTTVSRTGSELRVKSDLELLNISMPRNLYQAGCLHTVFDDDCGLDKAAWRVGGSAVAGSTITRVSTGLVQPDDWFGLGTLTFNSGANAGQTRTVKRYAGGVLELILPLPHPPQPGDLFDVYPGCDRKQPTCGGKFNNIGHFRGCPYIPEPETAL